MQEAFSNRVSSHHDQPAQHEHSAPVAAPQGAPWPSTKPNQAPTAGMGPGNAELTAWLERVGTVNAIEAILGAERTRQQALAASSDAPARIGRGLDGLGWLTGAVRAALQQHLEMEDPADAGPVTIPLDLHLTPTLPRQPHRTTDPSAPQASRWTRVARISIGASASGERAARQGKPAEQLRPTGATPSSETRWTPVGNLQLRAHLHHFLASSPTPPDIKTAVSGLMAWWKLHEPTISAADSDELVGLLHNFIHTWLRQQDPTALPEPTARALLPAACAHLTAPELDLDPRIYSCNDVAQLHNYQDSTIRRCAIKSWRQGPGPHPLRGIPVANGEWQLR